MKKVIIPILIIIVVLVLLGSFKLLKHDSKEFSSTKDISDVVNIEGVDLEVIYKVGNMIDEEIPYGNKVSKVIEIKNNTDRDASFAVKISEVILSDDDLKYNVYYSYDDSLYNSISEGINLTKDDNLAYNLVVESKSTLFLKIDFFGNNQVAPTKFTGKLSVISNLSDKDIYRANILAINSNINENINHLNGINEKGYFIVNVDTLKEEIRNKFKGYVLIDATDYSDLKFHYFVHDDKYMLNNYNLVDNDVLKKRIQDVDENVVNSFTFDNVCSNFTKKGCTDFQNLTFNPNGGKENFYKASMEVINSVKSDFKNKENLVYIYDLKKDIVNNTNIRGYILVDNTSGKSEYYLYLTNDIYMISGYNMTKLGDFSIDSKTIRSYSDSAFNLSSLNPSTVCSFSGFSECFNIMGEKV